MSMGSRIRRVTARVARLFAILSSINLLTCAIALGRPSLKSPAPLKNPGTTTGAASTFGQITSDATPPSATTAPYRVLQFAMKYLF